jgi:ureidoacrylate peracid hydrolase
MTARAKSDPMLSSILSPEWAAVQVVDVQNDFCHESGAYGALGLDMGAVQTAVRALASFLERARAASVPVIFTQMPHGTATNSTAWLNRSPLTPPEACVAGTWGAEFYRLQPKDGDTVIGKHRYSPFVGTDLEMVLKAPERRSILATGVATNICVESAIRDAFMRDYNVVLVEDCAAAFDAGEHAATVQNVRKYFGRVLASKTIAAHWRRHRAKGAGKKR